LPDVLIPWENVLFYRHTKAASFLRATLHRYSAYAFVLRSLKVADMMIGAALLLVDLGVRNRKQKPSPSAASTDRGLDLR
jgi:4-hydroxyphenylacetate 3-monooxygenase